MKKVNKKILPKSNSYDDYLKQCKELEAFIIETNRKKTEDIQNTSYILYGDLKAGEIFAMMPSEFARDICMKTDALNTAVDLTSGELFYMEDSVRCKLLDIKF